jgi:hypothetical protein
MNTILSILGAAFMLLSVVSDAQAAACARGVRGAACAGPNGAVAAPRAPVAVVPPKGAVVVPPPKGAVVVPPAAARGCHWVNGVKVCR